MTIIDKAAWQIDGGVPKEQVVKHFNAVFMWLDKHEMLTVDGKEELEIGIDEETSLNERHVTAEGFVFLEQCYDEYLAIIAKDGYGSERDAEELERTYQKYLNKKN